jgi:hypothetical protein
MIFNRIKLLIFLCAFLLTPALFSWPFSKNDDNPSWRNIFVSLSNDPKFRDDIRKCTANVAEILARVSEMAKNNSSNVSDSSSLTDLLNNEKFIQDINKSIVNGAELTAHLSEAIKNMNSSEFKKFVMELSENVGNKIDRIHDISENFKIASENANRLSSQIAKSAVLGFASIYAAYRGVKAICSGCSEGYDCYLKERKNSSSCSKSALQGLKNGGLRILGGSALLAGSGVIVYYGLKTSR